MGNCLVTKLKGTVDNNSLPVYNGFKFEALEETNFVKKRITFLGTEEIKLSIVSGNGYMSPYNSQAQYTEMTILPNVETTIDFSNGNYTVLLTGKYGLKKFSILAGEGSSNVNFRMDIEELRYCLNLIMLTGSFSKLYGDIDVFKDKVNLDTLALSNAYNIYGDWKNLKNLPLTRCYLYQTKVYGNLADLPNFITELETSGNVDKIYGTLAQLGEHTNLTAFGLVGNCNISGNVGDLGALTSLTRFFLSEKQDYSGFTGSVEGFVAAQIVNGRTSVTTAAPIYCPWFLNLATFGGNKYPNATGRMWLTWDNANKITVYNGGTDIASSTTVYAKGATAAEIDAWEQAGKTVVQIS